MFSLPYGRPAASPYWGPKTSAVNFCEEVDVSDYIITRYIGELVNTLTSLAYVGYGAYAIHRSRKQHVSPLAALNLPYWGLIAIGICSGGYHATLKYHTQMSDEMSMHAAMGCVLFRLFTFQRPLEIQRRNGTAIVVGLTSFIVYHCVTDEFVLHVIIFFGLCLTVGWKTRQVIQSRSDSKEAKEKLAALVTLGLGNALFAFGLWNIDVHFCQMITRWKHSVGMPWGFFLEFHGWWHMLTAGSCYLFMSLIEFLTVPKHDALDFAWPAKAVLRELRPVVGTDHVEEIKDHANGRPKDKRK